MKQPVGVQKRKGFADVKEDVEKSDERDSGRAGFGVAEELVEPSDLEVRLGVVLAPVAG